MDLEEEAVALGLGQRVGALALDGVLGGEHGEVGRERVGVAVDGDGALLHGLEQRALGLGGRAVDLVGEQERREDRPLDEVERVVLEVEDVRARDVGGHEIGGELDAVGLGAEDVGEGADEEGLGDAGDPFDEGVLAGEHGDERLVDGILLADDDLAHLGAGGGEEALELVEVVHAEGAAYRYRVMISPVEKL